MSSSNSPKCGIILPNISNEDTPENYWEEVQIILEDAVKNIGFEPFFVRKNIDTSVIKKIKEEDIIICDISSQNPHLMFELGMRVGLNKTTVFIKSEKSKWQYGSDFLEFVEYPYDLRYVQVVAFQRKLQDYLRAITHHLQLDLPQNPTYSNISSSPKTTIKPPIEETTFHSVSSKKIEETPPPKAVSIDPEPTKIEGKPELLPKGYVMPTVDDMKDEIAKVERDRGVKSPKVKTKPTQEKPQKNTIDETTETKYISNEKFKTTYQYLRRFMDEHGINSPKELQEQKNEIYIYFVKSRLIPDVYPDLEDLKYTVDYVIAN